MVCILQAMCQTSLRPVGARANGMANAAAATGDGWSVFNNPAGLSSTSGTSFNLTFETIPGLPEFNRTAAAVCVPIAGGVTSAGVYRFGDDLFSEQLLTIGYSSKMGIASLGLKGNMIQFHAEGFGSRRIYTIGFGGIAELTKWLTAGAYIVNINQPEIAEGEKLETTLIAGLSCKPAEKVLLVSEVEKNIALPAQIKAAVEYHLTPRVIIRTGFNYRPNGAFFGAGFNPGKITLDYAYSYLPSFTARHQLSLRYRILKEKPEP